MKLVSKKFAGNQLNFTSTALDHANLVLWGDEEGNLFFTEKVKSKEKDADGNAIYVPQANYDIPDDVAEELLAEAQLGLVVFEAPAAPSE
jgi:hypothetical protein